MTICVHTTKLPNNHLSPLYLQNYWNFEWTWWTCHLWYSKDSQSTYLPTSDEPEPSWLEPYLELKDFQLGSARDLFHFSSKIGRKRAEIRFSVEDLFFINFHNNLD